MVCWFLNFTIWIWIWHHFKIYGVKTTPNSFYAQNYKKLTNKSEIFNIFESRTDKRPELYFLDPKCREKYLKREKNGCQNISSVSKCLMWKYHTSLLFTHLNLFSHIYMCVCWLTPFSFFEAIHLNYVELVINTHFSSILFCSSSHFLYP